jgi:mannosyltransferase
MTGITWGRTAWQRIRKLRQREAWVVGAIVLLALALRFYDLTGESLWYDETYSVWTSGMNILSPLLLWRWQVEFPLYYWLLHIWMRLFGGGEFSVRAFGACAGAISAWPMYCLGRELGRAYGAGRRGGVIAALLLAVNPYHIWYSQEVRMYAWAVLTTLGSLYAFWRLARSIPARSASSAQPGTARWPWWLAHIVLTGLTFHLHYYIGWMMLAQNLYYLGWLWLSGRGIFTRSGWPFLRRWLLDQAGVLLLALPAFFVFYTKAVGLNQWGWLAERYGPPGLAEVVDLVLVYILGLAFPGPRVARWAILLLAGLLLAFGLWRTLQHIRGEPGRQGTGPQGEVSEGNVRQGSWDVWQSYSLAALTTVVPIGAVLILSQRSATWVPRYMLLFLPSFLLWLALGIGALLRPGLRIGVVIVWLATSLYALSGMYGAPQKEQWREAAAYLHGRVSPEDLIVLIDGDCRVPLGYYLGDAGRRVDVSRSANENEAELGQAMAEIVHQQKGGHLWLVVSHAQSDNLERALDRLPGLARAGTVNWVGITLVNYAWS